MSIQNIRGYLAAQPNPGPLKTCVHEAAVKSSLSYLESDEALLSIRANPYWPKWNSPWWHMSVLHEMGMAPRIPRSCLQEMVAALEKQYPHFPFKNGAVIPCVCEIGNIFQILSAAGINMDEALPWARPWLLGKQMSDGGLSCDDEAYLAEPQASSIVGTIAPLEALLYFTPRPFTVEEETFLKRGAICLLERNLSRGCSAQHNRSECHDEEDWLKPCFPRFYLYDALRGLNFILHWSEKFNMPISADAIVGVLGHFSTQFPDGIIRNSRHSYEGVSSRGGPASYFTLLTQVSELAQPSVYLTAQWQGIRNKANALLAAGLIQ